VSVGKPRSRRPRGAKPRRSAAAAGKRPETFFHVAMILIRHGQSEFNVVYSATRRDPGIPDPKLTDEGRRQAAAVAQALGGSDLVELISSPYTRALETAEIIAGRLGLPIRIEPLVREHCRFQCDIGSPRSHLAQRWPALDFAHLPEQWWPNLDETDAALLGRCADFRGRMAARHDWQRVAVVSHWGFIRGLTGESIVNGQHLPFDPR
jgi:broad specificity phosphatase PhoE